MHIYPQKGSLACPVLHASRVKAEYSNVNKLKMLGSTHVNDNKVLTGRVGGCRGWPRSVQHGDDVGTILMIIPTKNFNELMNSKIRYMMWPARKKKEKRPRTILSLTKEGN